MSLVPLSNLFTFNFFLIQLKNLVIFCIFFIKRKKMTLCNYAALNKNNNDCLQKFTKIFSAHLVQAY